MSFVTKLDFTSDKSWQNKRIFIEIKKKGIYRKYIIQSLHEVLGLSDDWVIPFYKYLALRQFREAGPKYPISCAGKVIQSLQLQISHQMRPYSNVKAIRGSSSYTCLRVFGH